MPAHMDDSFGKGGSMLREPCPSGPPGKPGEAAQALRPLPGDYSYDLALSFAGEDREVARQIAQVVQANGLRVFFDEYYVWETWGKDLSEYLGSIYGDGARYCLILISEDYCRKPYTTFERRIALARALESKEEYVLPVVLDDSWPPGLPRTTAYLDLRVMRRAEVAEAVVYKIRGKSWDIRRADNPPAPSIEVLDKDVLAFPERSASMEPSLIDFANVAIAAECSSWNEGSPYVEDSWSNVAPRWSFRGGGGYYEDPVFDITILNRSDAPRLISRVGIIALGTSFGAYTELGGGGAEPVLLHRTYEIMMPDLWAVLAEGQRNAFRNLAEAREKGVPRWINTDQRSSCRLPDPILIDPGKAYRFGLHLLDYTGLSPTEVELEFWVQTDKEEARSGRTRLSYLIGSDIPQVERYRRMLRGAMETERQSAMKLMYRSTSPEDQDRYLRVAQFAGSLSDRGIDRSASEDSLTADERKQATDLIAEDTLLPVHTWPI